MKTALFKNLASLVDARLTCIARSFDGAQSHDERILELVKNHMPSGAGFDNGTRLDRNSSTGERLVFTTGFHHMNDGGFYDGWTEHKVTCTPSLMHDFTLKISGPNRNDIKEHIHEVFTHALQWIESEVPALTPEEKAPEGFKIYVSIEPVDSEGDKAGEDLDVPFAYSGMFKTADAAQDLASLMHEHGRTLAPYVEEKHHEI